LQLARSVLDILPLSLKSNFSLPKYPLRKRWSRKGPSNWSVLRRRP